MHVTLCFLSLFLFLSGSQAHMCYKCTSEAGDSDTSPNSCIGGKFDKHALPDSVEIMDCGGAGCAKMVAVMDKLGYTEISRDCSPSILTEDKCFHTNTVFNINKLMEAQQVDPKDNIDPIVCVCHSDFCNGAGRLNSRQAIMGIVAGVLAVLMQY